MMRDEGRREGEQDDGIVMRRRFPDGVSAWGAFENEESPIIVGADGLFAGARVRGWTALTARGADSGGPESVARAHSARRLDIPYRLA
jgi:hypothetical protein